MHHAPKLIEALQGVARKGLNTRLAERDEPLLVWAVSEGYPDIARALIGAGADLNACNSDGNTPLLRAACEGRADLAHALMRAGADLDRQNHDGYSPLILARRRGNTAIADALERAGADVHLTTREGLNAANPGDSPKQTLSGPRDAALERELVQAIRACGAADGDGG